MKRKKKNYKQEGEEENNNNNNNISNHLWFILNLLLPFLAKFLMEVFNHNQLLLSNNLSRHRRFKAHQVHNLLHNLLSNTLLLEGTKWYIDTTTPSPQNTSTFNIRL